MSVKVLILLIYFILGGALINNELFGLPTLAAYFLYMIAVSTSALFLFLNTLTTGTGISFYMPLHAAAFFAFCIYVNVHGLFSNAYDIIHLYWLNNAIFFGYLILLRENGASEPKSIAIKVSKVVTIIAALESLIVLFQAAGIFKTQNNLFIASGTWANPNVTAVFLAISIHFVLGSELYSKKRSIGLPVLAGILLSLLLLQSRTAFIVASLAIFFKYQPNIINWFNKVFASRGRIIFRLLVVMGMAISAVILVNVKLQSTSGRLLVYKNSTGIIKGHFLTGNGFGHFERSYNHFVAENKLPSNGHINMAFNDFIEMTVEGGIIALLLWVFFLVCTGVHTWRKKQSLFHVSAILAVQLTNFGFQAVPVMAILLLSVALPLPAGTPAHLKAKKPDIKIQKVTGLRFNKNYGLAMVLLLLFLAVYEVRMANAFRELSKIPPREYARSINSFKKLEGSLSGQPFFHEKFGDAYLNMRNVRLAMEQYRFALQNCSYPQVIVKCGYTYQEQKIYDSSIYYYNLAQNIEPFKFATQMVILKMYEHKKDTVNALRTATKILTMPVKVESAKVDEIKRYADNVLLKIKKSS